MKKVVIFGAGDFAQLVHYYLMHDSSYQVAAFTVDKSHMIGDEVSGLPLIPFEEIEKQYPPDGYDMFIAIGYSKVNKVRANKYYEAKQKGYNLITYINSGLKCWDNLEVGDNCFIFEDQTIQPFVKIGNNVIIWSGNHIGHHSVISDHCFITSHVVISGYTKIEPYCFIGVNATIRDKITIARECVIGAGATILQDTQEKTVYATKSTEPLFHDSSNLREI